jgi:hypothetical protein
LAIVCYDIPKVGAELSMVVQLWKWSPVALKGWSWK